MANQLKPQHNGNALTLDPRTFERGLSCVHCGLCLPACPTFTETGHEADSPRGRIQLMLALSNGTIDASESVRRHLDLCLDCRACESACPSGVVYHELIEEIRSRMSAVARPTLADRMLRAIFFQLFVHPLRLKLALLPARLLQKIGLYQLLRRSGIFRLLPVRLAKMEQMLPRSGELWPRPLPTVTQPLAQKKLTVGFFPGCIGSVMFTKVNRQAVDLLAASGAQVIVPPSAGCCGAIHQHNGSAAAAQAMARGNINAYLSAGVDRIATNIAGCGAMLREYDFVLRDDPQYTQRAREFCEKVRDISEVLAELGVPQMKHRIEQTATYHDACHLAHAQKVTTLPRKLLSQIPGLKLVPLAESDMCCGAAGTYNLTQPRMSRQLAQRKLEHIAATGATLCITGNVGCAMQIQSEALAHGQELQVVHPVQLLHEAVFGSERPRMNADKHGIAAAG